jgi:hypothetical protein
MKQTLFLGFTTERNVNIPALISLWTYAKFMRV